MPYCKALPFHSCDDFAPMIRRALLTTLVAFLAVTAASAETLRGGSTATLSLSLDRLPPHAEEWEAFLSLDGGAHYAIRITPHLDLNVRRVRWVIPNVDAAAARIMLRVGDEREEISYELPETFAIARDAAAPLPPMRAAPFTHAEDGVVAWAEGDRAGTRVALATNAPPPSGIEAVRAAVAADDELIEESKASCAVVLRWISRASPATQQPSNRETPRPRDLDVLLLSTRLNV